MNENKKDTIKLIALDMDGTLLDENSRVSQGNKAALAYAIDHGVKVVISTGRPLSALSVEELKDMGIQYAVTTNGAAVYDLTNGECLFESVFPMETAQEILEKVEGLKLHVTAHVGGTGYCPLESKELIPDLLISDYMKEIYYKTRVFLPELRSWLLEGDKKVQKITINFRLVNGVVKYRDELEAYLNARGDVSAVCGGWNNIETTMKGVDKGAALLRLGKMLGVEAGQIMAMGDSENDMSMLKVAGLAVVMENGKDRVKEIADYITLSNEEDGVAAAIYEYID